MSFITLDNQINKNMKIIECPRDAMQGLEQYIPAATKADYINSLLSIGFDTIEINLVFLFFTRQKGLPKIKLEFDKIIY